MLNKIFHKLLAKRHPWREMGFSELSELYTSMMFRNLALSLVGIFVPIYLYQLGYSLATIMLFFSVLFFIRVPWDILSGYIIARIGPKHSMAYSYIFQIIGLAFLISLESNVSLIWLSAVFLGMSAGLFFNAYHVDFSKIKHSKNGGKELGFMVIMEKLGSMLGPIVGGLIAVTVGVRYSFIAAIVFFIIGLIPLFMTHEPVKTKQVIKFHDFPFIKVRRDRLSYTMITIENNICLVIWPLFIALFVLTDNVYLSLGVLASAGVVVSILSAQAIGRLIDDRKGRTLFNYSIIINTILHLIRPFVTTIGQVFTLNLVNEAATSGYRMPWIKGFYDKADDLPGHRIVYVAIMESTASFGRALTYLVLAFSTLILTEKNVFVFAFLLGAVASILITTEKFPALRGK